MHFCGSNSSDKTATAGNFILYKTGWDTYIVNVLWVKAALRNMDTILMPVSVRCNGIKIAPSSG